MTQRYKPGHGALAHLLSGIARCGKCSGTMRGGRGRGSKVRYFCHSERGGCGGVARVAEPVDELIINLALGVRSRKTRDQAQNTLVAWTRDGELRQAERDHAELMEAKQAGRVSMATVLGLLEPLEARLHALRSEKRRMQAEAERAAVTADSRAAFDALSLEAKREFIRDTISAVIIHPSGRGKRFDPALIEPVWA